MTSAFIVMRVCRSCGRGVIATVYRLRVVIATPPIELGDFRCNTGLIEICVPDATQAGHVDCGFRLPPTLGCGLLLDESQCGPDGPTGGRTCPLL
jgi:hypothetical protein